MGTKASKKLPFNPDWASSPGDTIQHCMEEKGISVSDLAKAMKLSAHVTDHLVNGRIPIDRMLAERLSSALGSNPLFWLKRQAEFDDRITKLIKKGDGSGRRQTKR